MRSLFQDYWFLLLAYVVLHIPLAAFVGTVIKVGQAVDKDRVNAARASAPTSTQKIEQQKPSEFTSRDLVSRVVSDFTVMG